MPRRVIRKGVEKYNYLYDKHNGLMKFGTYVFVGGVATVVDFSLLYSLTEFLGLWYIFSAIASYCVSIVVHFTLSKIVTFRNKSKKLMSQLFLFVLVASVGLLLNVAIMYALVEFFSLWYIFAKIISTVLVLIWSYNGHKYITFGMLK
ncbi:GtrA family protein [Thermoproteota archaeon]